MFKTFLIDISKCISIFILHIKCVNSLYAFKITDFNFGILFVIYLGKKYYKNVISAIFQLLAI